MSALPPPRERYDTLPDEWPERSIGWHVAAWMMDYLIQPNGPNAGKPFCPTPRQIQFLVNYYAVNERGEFVYRRGARRLAKGSGKSPFAAAFALAELCGPVRFGGWDESGLAGIKAVPVSMPLVQIVATSERQTQNTIRMVRAFSAKGTKVQRAYELDSNKTFIETPTGGKLEQVTSSAHTLEGGEVSAAVCDEVEHWLPAQGGPEVMRTVVRNAAKVDGSRVLETCNAWIPGEKSTAEDTFDAWLKQEDGLTRGKTRILYDAVIARPNAVMVDDVEEGQIPLTEELKRIYADCPWVNLEQIKEQIWSPDIPESHSMRFFFNKPCASENAWVTLDEWNMCSDTDRKVEDGEPIVMFFDGSKSDDHTALVGCCMKDGHIFKLGHWRPGASKVVNTHAVNAGVEAAFRKYDVLAFWADVREWESFTKVTWPEKYRDRLILPAEEASPIAWDMRTHARQFAEAAEAAFTEITQQEFTHSGDSALAEHVSNARVFEQRGRWSIRKESPKSSHKIDLAVCMVGARMLYRNVLVSKAWQRRTSGGKWKVFAK